MAPMIQNQSSKRTRQVNSLLLQKLQLYLTCLKLL